MLVTGASTLVCMAAALSVFATGTAGLGAVVIFILSLTVATGTPMLAALNNDDTGRGLHSAPPVTNVQINAERIDHLHLGPEHGHHIHTNRDHLI